jgi:hypothetical protein
LPWLRREAVGVAVNLEVWRNAYLLGRMADVASTWAILKQGGLELNGLWVGVYQSGGAIAALGWQLIAAAPLALLVKRLPVAWRLPVGLGLLASSWVPVVWNAWVLYG